MFPRRPPTDEAVSVFDAVVAKKGQTTAPGAPGGTSIIDSSLIGAGANSFVNMAVVLYTGDPRRVDARSATAFNNLTGELTLDAAYKGVAAAIPAGVPYILIPLEIVPGGGAPIVLALNVPAIDSIVNLLERDVIGNKADTPNHTIGNTSSLMRYVKAILGYIGIVPPTIAATATMTGSVVANWQAAEQDLLTIGAAVAGQATVINFLGVGIQNLAGNIAIRMYVTINGVERRIAPIPAGLTFSVAADAPCIPMINSTMAFPGRLRVTVQSNNPADNGAAVTYEAV